MSWRAKNRYEEDSTINYVTDINKVNKELVLTLAEFSVQAYNAFSSENPSLCGYSKSDAPADYTFLACFSGVDSIFGVDDTVECFGLILRSKDAPYSYYIAFRGTDSVLDWVDDLGVEFDQFVPYTGDSSSVSNVQVEAGFYDVYTESKNSVGDPDFTPSMQEQIFKF